MECIAIAATSLNGLITRGDHPGTRFTSEADKQWFAETMKSFPAKVMGRKTFEASRDFILERVAGNASELRLVATRSPEDFLRLEVPERLYFTDQPPAELVARARQMGHSRLAILGGSSIYHVFLQAGLIDEFWITLEPRLFGSGTPLLQVSPHDYCLELNQQVQLTASTLLLKYRILS